jgi:hypothetical protein
MKKILNTLLIIFFPLGVLYCVGKNLFSGNFASFLGGIFLVCIGFCLAIYFLRPDLIEQILVFFQSIKK